VSSALRFLAFLLRGIGFVQCSSICQREILAGLKFIVIGVIKQQEK
jgi:hypothetical protein